MFFIRLRSLSGKSIATVATDQNDKKPLVAFPKFQCFIEKLGKTKPDLLFFVRCKKQSVVPMLLWLKVVNRNLKTSSAYHEGQIKFPIKKLLLNGLTYENIHDKNQRCLHTSLRTSLRTRPCPFEVSV